MGKIREITQMIQTEMKNDEINIFIFSHEICLICLTHLINLK